MPSIKVAITIFPSIWKHDFIWFHLPLRL
jgi:hypothetical protein